MAYRKPTRRRLHAKDVLPIWGKAEADTVNMAAVALFQWMGVTDAQSYFRKLCIPVVISVIVCACIGASSDGITGFLSGALLGIAAPAALLWFMVLLVGIAIYLGVYVLAWAVVWAIFKWCLSEFFRS